MDNVHKGYNLRMRCPGQPLTRWRFVGLFLILAGLLQPSIKGAAQSLPKPAAASAYDLIQAVNSLRGSHGLPAYNVNSILMQIAQQQADYLASTGGVYGHIGPGGTRPFQRALAAGYPVAGDLSQGGLFSENWAAAQSIQGAMGEWTDSVHMLTMLSPDLQDIGAGIGSDGNENYYVIDCGLASGSAVNYQPPFGGTIVAGTGTASTGEPTIAAVIVSTPDQSGNVYQVVQPGQSLWQIALAYKTTVNNVKNLNGLTSNDIYVGQKLLIARVGTPTPIPPTAKPTHDPSTPTSLPTFEYFSPTATATETKIPVAPSTGHAGTIAVAVILGVALVAAGLVSWAGRKQAI